MATHRKGTSRIGWVLGIALALVGSLLVAPATSANAAGSFVCEAVVGRLATGHYGMVNGDPVTGDPLECADGYFGLNTLDLGFAQVTGLEAYTDGYNESAYASAATVVIQIGRVHIVVGAVTARAGLAYSPLHGYFVSTSSKVVGLRINGGLARVVTGYTKINILGLVVLELNKTTYNLDGTVTRQALVVSSSTTPGKLVIGEATAGFGGGCDCT